MRQAAVVGWFLLVCLPISLPSPGVAAPAPALPLHPNRPQSTSLPCIAPPCCPPPTTQGHIALDSAVWPEGTPGCAIDVLARLPLWGMGLNYRHGTGHGVGAALNVHEGPQSISSRWAGGCGCSVVKAGVCGVEQQACIVAAALSLCTAATPLGCCADRATGQWSPRLILLLSAMRVPSCLLQVLEHPAAPGAHTVCCHLIYLSLFPSNLLCPSCLLQVLEHPAPAGAHGVQQRAGVLRGRRLWHSRGESVCGQGSKHRLQVRTMQSGGGAGGF